MAAAAEVRSNNVSAIWPATSTSCVRLAFTLLVRSPEPRWIVVGASLGFLIAFLLLFSLMRGNRRRWMEHAAGESRESLILAQ